MRRSLALGLTGLVLTNLVPLGRAAAQELAAVPDASFEFAKVERYRALVRLEKEQLARVQRALATMNGAAEQEQRFAVAEELDLLALDLKLEQARIDERTARERYEAAKAAYESLRDRKDLPFGDPGREKAFQDSLDAFRAFDLTGVALADARLAVETRKSPLEAVANRANAARSLFEQSVAELEATQNELVALLPQFLVAVLRNPPPFVERIEISSSGKMLYAAQWREQKVEQTPPASGNQSKAVNAVVDRIQMLQAGIANEQILRAELLPRAALLQPRFDALYDRAGTYRFWGEVVAIGLDSLGTFIDLYSSGGASSLAGVWQGLARDNAAKVKVIEIGAGKFGSERYADAVEDYIDQIGSRPERSGGSLKKAAQEGTKVLMGDALELAISAAPTAIAGTLIENPVTGLSQFGSNLKEGRLVSALTAIAKAGAVAFAEYYASEAEREFTPIALELAAVIASLRGSREREFAMRAELKENVVALNRAAYLLGNKGRVLELQVERDEPMQVVDRQRGFEVRVSFPSPQALAPTILVPGGRVTDWEKVDALGMVWRGRLPPIPGATSVPERLPLTITLNPASQPYSRLDGRPETPARLGGPELRWSGIETVPDTRHALRGRNVDGGLSGVWGFYAEFLVEQNGDDVTIRFRRRDPIIAIEAGALYFEGKLTAQNQLVGRRTWYPPRSRGCAAGGMVLPAQWTITRDATGRATTLQGAMPEGVFNIECRFSAKDYTDRPTIHRDLRSNTIRE